MRLIKLRQTVCESPVENQSWGWFRHDESNMIRSAVLFDQKQCLNSFDENVLFKFRTGRRRESLIKCWLLRLLFEKNEFLCFTLFLRLWFLMISNDFVSTYGWVNYYFNLFVLLLFSAVYFSVIVLRLESFFAVVTMRVVLQCCWVKF